MPENDIEGTPVTRQHGVEAGFDDGKKVRGDPFDGAGSASTTSGERQGYEGGDTIEAVTVNANSRKSRPMILLISKADEDGDQRHADRKSTVADFTRADSAAWAMRHSMWR